MLSCSVTQHVLVVREFMTKWDVVFAVRSS